jgi:hypothetical protein
MKAKNIACSAAASLGGDRRQTGASGSSIFRPRSVPFTPNWVGVLHALCRQVRGPWVV